MSEEWTGRPATNGPFRNSSVRRVFHLTAVVRDRDATVDQLRRLFGAVVLHTAEGDTFGVELSRAMLWIGDNLLEVIQPVGESPFQSFLERFGGGLNSLGLRVDDAAAAEEQLSAHGVEVAVRFTADMFATRTAGTAGLALQWTTQDFAGDPRVTGDIPEPPAEAVVRVERLASVLALVEHPAEAAASLAAAMGTRAMEVDGWGAGPAASVAAGDCSLVLHSIEDPELTRATWGAAHTRPRLLALGLQVPDVGRAVDALERAGFGTIGRDPSGGVVVDPSGLSIAVVLYADLPPGDPRAGSLTGTP